MSRLTPSAALAAALGLLALGFALLTPAALAASAPDQGVPWEPEPLSRALYGTRAPDANPDVQRHVVEGGDGTDLFVETWLPADKDGAVAPGKVPTILIMTPYVQDGVERYPSRNLEPVIAYFTARGYAVAQHHVRGTGSSGGCLEQTAANQIDDGARVVEYLGRDAPWSNGSVGMYGISYDAETQISVAGRGDPEKTKYLKAIIPSETVGGQYEYSNMDGVPFTGQAALSNGGYLATTSLAPGEAPVGVHTFERFGCQPDLLLGSVDTSGDLTPFWKVREYRPEITSFRAATLWLHGFADWNVQPITLGGSFDRIPQTTPHKAIVGVWEHNYPDKHAGVQPEWARQDWLATATAWYDRYLKGLETRTETWPAAQVQGSDGQWRAEAGFPRTGGAAGQLALGPGGVLGASESLGTPPTGSTPFTEGPDDDETVPGSRAVFETQPVNAALHLTGEFVADLWLRTSMPDAHLTAKLQVLGADGSPLVFEGSVDQEIGTWGARSLRHLEPMPDGYFAQELGAPAPTDETLRVPLRFQPNDIVVPAGGKLRLTIAGGTSWARETTPSGSSSTITILHDCEHPSALRFLMARQNGILYDVRETDEKGPLTGSVDRTYRSDGDGLATMPVCGRRPERLESFGPEVDLNPLTPGIAGGLPPRPAVGPPARRGSLRVRIVRQRLGRVLARGLRLRTTCTGDCRTYRARVHLTKAMARRLHIRRIVGTSRPSGGLGTRTLVIRFTAKARLRLATVRRLRLTATLIAGHDRVAQTVILSR